MKNKVYIPHFITVIFFATLLVVLTSWIGSIYEWPVQSLLSPEGLRWTLRHVDENLYQTPFASIFILLIGMGLAYASGLFSALQQHIRRISLHKPLSRKQKRALLLALLSGIVYLLLVGIATFSPLAILLGVTGTLDRSPFIDGIIPLISLAFGITGLVFGIASGQFCNDRDVIQGMGSLPVRFVHYFIYLLFASQFLGILHYSQIDRCMGIGENGLRILYFFIYYFPLIGVFFYKNPEVHASH